MTSLLRRRRGTLSDDDVSSASVTRTTATPVASPSATRPLSTGPEHSENDAERCLQDALAQFNASKDNAAREAAAHTVGVMLWRQGKLDEAYTFVFEYLNSLPKIPKTEKPIEEEAHELFEPGVFPTSECFEAAVDSLQKSKDNPITKLPAPELHKLELLLGNISLSRNKLDDAIRFFDRAYLLKPQDIMTAKSLGVCLHEGGYVMDAVNVFIAAWNLSERKDLEIGRCLVSALWDFCVDHEIDQEYREFEACKLINGKESTNQRNAQSKKDVADPLISVVREMLVKWPEEPDLTLALAKALAFQGDLEQAIQIGKTMEIPGSEFYSVVVNCLIKWHLAKNEIDKADELLKKLKSEDDENEEETVLNRLRFHVAKGEEQAAISIFSQAICNAPDSVGFHAEMGAILGGRGNQQRVDDNTLTKCYEAFVAKHPKSQGADYYKQYKRQVIGNPWFERMESPYVKGAVSVVVACCVLFYFYLTT